MCLRPLTCKIESRGHIRIITHSFGKCLECVSQLQNDWANRMSDEFKCWKHAYFGTFTYGNSCIPYVDVLPSELPPEKFDYLCNAFLNHRANASRSFDILCNYIHYADRRHFRSGFFHNDTYIAYNQFQRAHNGR